MTRGLSARLAKLELIRRGPAPYGIELPHGHPVWDADPAVADAALRDAIAEHVTRTGYAGPFLICPPLCEIEEEWDRLHGREATR